MHRAPPTSAIGEVFEVLSVPQQRLRRRLTQRSLHYHVTLSTLEDQKLASTTAVQTIKNDPQASSVAIEPISSPEENGISSMPVSMRSSSKLGKISKTASMISSAKVGLANKATAVINSARNGLGNKASSKDTHELELWSEMPGKSSSENSSPNTPRKTLRRSETDAFEKGNATRLFITEARKQAEGEGTRIALRASTSKSVCDKLKGKKALKWLHIKSDSMTLQEFLETANGEAGVASDSHALVSTLMEAVRRELEKSFKFGSFLTPRAVLCDGDLDGSRDRSQYALFLAYPYKVFEKHNPTKKPKLKNENEKEFIHPPRSLLQTGQRLDSTQNRDEKQVVRLMSRTDNGPGNNKILVVRQFWVMLVNDGMCRFLDKGAGPMSLGLTSTEYMITCSQHSQAELCHGRLSQEPVPKKECMFIRCIDCKGKTRELKKKDCPSWFHLRAKLADLPIVGLEGQDPTNGWHTVQDLQITAYNWTSILETAKNELLELHSPWLFEPLEENIKISAISTPLRSLQRRITRIYTEKSTHLESRLSQMRTQTKDFLSGGVSMGSELEGMEARTLAPELLPLPDRTVLASQGRLNGSIGNRSEDKDNGVDHSVGKEKHDPLYYDPAVDFMKAEAMQKSSKLGNESGESFKESSDTDRQSKSESDTTDLNAAEQDEGITQAPSTELAEEEDTTHESSAEEEESTTQEPSVEKEESTNMEPSVDKNEDKTKGSMVLEVNPIMTWATMPGKFHLTASGTNDQITKQIMDRTHQIFEYADLDSLKPYEKVAFQTYRKMAPLKKEDHYNNALAGLSQWIDERTQPQGSLNLVPIQAKPTPELQFALDKREIIMAARAIFELYVPLNYYTVPHGKFWAAVVKISDAHESIPRFQLATEVKRMLLVQRSIAEDIKNGVRLYKVDQPSPYFIPSELVEALRSFLIFIMITSHTFEHLCKGDTPLTAGILRDPAAFSTSPASGRRHSLSPPPVSLGSEPSVMESSSPSPKTMMNYEEDDSSDFPSLSAEPYTPSPSPNSASRARRISLSQSIQRKITYITRAVTPAEPSDEDGNGKRKLCQQELDNNLRYITRLSHETELQMRRGMNQLIRMAGTDYKPHPTFGPASLSEVSAKIISQLSDHCPIDGLPFKFCDIIDMYTEYASRLLEIQERPRKRLLMDVTMFEHEMNLVRTLYEDQITALRELAKYLDFIASLRISTDLGKDTNGNFQDRSIYEEDGDPAIPEISTILSTLAERLERLQEILGLAEILRTQAVNLADFKNEEQGKAIFVFTIVTVIFLPLSFVSSYFGMNTRDIRDMEKKQSTFWAVALPVTSVTLIVSCLVAFWGGSLKSKYWKWRFETKRSQPGMGLLDDEGLIERGIS
ncbi:hypothetical protein BJ508DRAFT_302386 [Ascobolus immersus RN42]|uniref:Cora-domain-containing protein n=1 Tax=Ascobolus immersus RN42 TaxID=1160509 RepID=A0A3N4IKR2_ASCIM|nr:hypothetical protein BJ508DRAFT_302386 [Ascobolus immersus RN42]